MNTTAKTFDVLVIGGGPGGIRTALLLCKRGFHVALAEQQTPGGVCLRRGCIPFKRFLHVSRVLYDAETLRADALLTGGALSLSLPALRQQTQQIVQSLEQSVLASLDACGAAVLHGTARILSQSDDGFAVAVGNETYTCKKLVLATGSRAAARPTAPDGASVTILDVCDLLKLERLPDTVDILGGGAAGLEAACFFAESGCSVTVVEASPQIGGGIDPDISRALERILRRKGVRCLTGTRLDRVEQSAVVCRQGDAVLSRTPQLLLCAAGRLPQFDAAQLDRIGVRYTPDGVRIDDRCRTTNRNVFACGDVTGGPMLAHRAYRQAKVIADVLCGKAAHTDDACIPRVICTSPEVLTVGRTEPDCTAAGIAFTAHTLPMRCSGKSFAENGHDGARAKMIVDAEKRLLGFHMVGRGASELSLAAELMVQRRMTTDAIEDLVFAHPTYGEIIGELAARFNA